MDEDTNKSDSTPAAKCKNPTKCNRLRTLRQQQTESTQLLFVGQNFRATRSDQDIFFDCLSATDNDSPQEGRSQTCGSKFDDPDAIRAALERAANATQMLLKNFDQSSAWNRPCEATLEITARLIRDPKHADSACRLKGKPVTVQMPLQFNPQSGQLSSGHGEYGQLQIQDQQSGPGARSKCICQASGQKPEVPMPMLPKPFKGNEDPDKYLPCERIDLDNCDSVVTAQYLESGGDSCLCKCTDPTCLMMCPNKYEMRDVISIRCLPVPPVDKVPESVSEDESLVDSVRTLVEEEPKSESPVESSPLITPSPTPSPQREPSAVKHYYLALPQHKEFSNCSPCRFDPSPIMDEDGNVFCPGNCGCCQCAWRKRSFDENREHINVKVCKCVQRGTIFTSFEDRETCSQTSYFDFCPCREKAEAKFLELYHCEMWSVANVIRGREVKLTEIRELLAPLPRPNS